MPAIGTADGQGVTRICPRCKAPLDRDETGRLCDDCGVWGDQRTHPAPGDSSWRHRQANAE